MRTGIDLVNLEEFRGTLERGGESLLHRLFHPSEIAGAPMERLAGIFAAKEAAFKALGGPQGQWHVVEIVHTQEGRPSITFAPEYDTSRILNVDLSITHSGQYAIASIVALMKE